MYSTNTLTNNPFVTTGAVPSSVTVDPRMHFPELAASDAAWDADMGLSAYLGINPSGGGYTFQHSPLPHVQHKQQQQPLPLSLSRQQQLGYSVALGMGYAQPSFTMAAQMLGTTQQKTADPPSMMYGQPLAMQSAVQPPAPSYYDFQQQQQQPPQQPPPQQQQTQTASTSQGRDGGKQDRQQQQRQQQQLQLQLQPQAASSSSSPSSPTRQMHPREYMRMYKAQLNAWDVYSWKQLLGALDALRNAWERRKRDMETTVSQIQMRMQFGHGTVFLSQTDGAELQAVSVFFLYLSFFFLPLLIVGVFIAAFE